MCSMGKFRTELSVHGGNTDGDGNTFSSPPAPIPPIRQPRHGVGPLQEAFSPLSHRWVSTDALDTSVDDADAADCECVIGPGGKGEARL